MTLKMPLKELSQRLQGTSVSAIVDPSIDKTALSVRASLASQLKSLEALEDAKPGQGLSLLNFAKEDQRTWLFLSCQPDQREFVKPLFSAWISLAIKGMMRRSEQNNSRTWIIIDELASLNRLPSLMLGLAEIRKYGGCVMLGFQDLNQLEEIYGPSNTKTLSNLTGTKVLFRNIDTDVSKRIAGFLGEQEKQEATESISFGAHQMRDGVSLGNHKQTKSVITASQIMMLKDLEAYLKFPGDFPTSKVSFEYLDVACRAPAFVERPTKPSTAKPQAAYPRTVEVEGLVPETHGLKLVSSQTQQIQQM
jgi:type IV secretory pathway TraG/TraD family ATPase VirD4